MGRRVPTIKARDLRKVLKKKGFYFVRQKGSHQVWTDGYDLWTTVPNHPGKDLGRGLTKQILNDLKLTKDEFLELL